ncbi:MAG: hypothetical protein H6718_13855 [Polyangiaceae bacterium]|nr:hypothetical protein [Myxococcales bacterium]MCB9586482.1 hypothetical protein [Polyangiaceae bacterium]MCB9605989.1 hypothetical protein [Polyangiaceae bacterium]
MKSNSPEASDSKQPPAAAPKSDLQTLIAVLLMLVCGLGVALNHAPLVARHAELKAKNDVYPLPSPEQTVVASLGYRSALADAIYAHVLVSYGLHIVEHRGFDFIGEYLDTISTLDPKFADPYRYADTFLILQAKKATRADYFKAREIFEKGMKELPNDTFLWITAGQYIAYIAPPHLGDDELFRQWRLDGARVLAHACELVGTNENLPYQCITAASLFSRAGEEEATETFLERVLAVSDDPEIQEMALNFMRVKLSEGARNRVQRRLDRLREARDATLPAVGKDRFLVIGPPLDAAKAAGRCDGRSPDEATSPDDPVVSCTSDWTDWEEASKLLEAQGK